MLHCSSFTQGHKAHTVLAYHWPITFISIRYAYVEYHIAIQLSQQVDPMRSQSSTALKFAAAISTAQALTRPSRLRQWHGRHGRQPTGPCSFGLAMVPAQGLGAISAPRSYQRASLPRACSCFPQIFGLCCVVDATHLQSRPSLLFPSSLVWPTRRSVEERSSLLVFRSFFV